MKSTKEKVFLQRNSVLVILLMVSLVFPILILNRLHFYKLPVGGDVGIWLKLSYAIFENNYPMWGSSSLQHGPLPFFILYLTSKIMGEIWAANIMGITLLVLRPVAVFFFAKKLLGNQYFALLCSTVDAFFPAYYEMYGFGGYPNLFAFVLLPLTFGYVLYSQTRLRNFVIYSFLSIVIILTHHLSSLMFLIIMFFWMMFRLFEKDKRYKFVGVILLITFLTFGVLQFLMGGESEYTFFNEFAYYGSVVTMARLLYVFKDLVFLCVLVTFALLGVFEHSKNDRQGSTLLLSWIISPILFYIISYFTKILIIDYTRLLFYTVQPLIIGNVCFLKFLWQKREKIVILKTIITSYKFIVIALSCLLVFTSFNFGYVTMNNVINYNKAVLENKFSDQNSYDMIMWIKGNLENNVTVVTRAPIIPRYIEGVAHKRVLMGSAPPKYLFQKDAYQRYLASQTILTSNIMGCSDMFQIKDQTPILFGRTPYVYIFAGDAYKLLGYFADQYPWELKKLTLNVTVLNVSNNLYEIKYTGPHLNVETIKTVMLQNDEVVVNYKILGKNQAMLIANMTLVNYFWFDWGKNWNFVNGTLFTDYGKVEVITNAISVEKEYVSLYKQWRLVFTFDSELSVTFKVEDIRMAKGNTVLTTSDDLIKQYGVTHALIRVDDKETMKWAEALGWKLVYNNALFYLYEISNSSV